jgi:hypothetical protein
MTDRMRISEYRALLTQKKKGKGQGAKYGSKAEVVDGIRFDSKKEAGRYSDLKIEDRAGTIQELELKPEYRLEVNGQLICKYYPDFRYKRNGLLVVEDVKSAATRLKASYRLKRKLMKSIFNIIILET